jgi:hypothetical protein
MVEEVSVNYLVDDYDNHNEKQPDPPMGNEVLPQAFQHPFRPSLGPVFVAELAFGAVGAEDDNLDRLAELVFVVGSQVR